MRPTAWCFASYQAALPKPVWPVGPFCLYGGEAAARAVDAGGRGGAWGVRVGDIRRHSGARMGQ